MSGHNCRKKRDASKHDCQSSIAIPKTRPSELLSLRGQFLTYQGVVILIYECLNSICYHLRAATKIWLTVLVRKTQ